MKPKNTVPAGPASLLDLSRRALLKTGLVGLSSLALGPSLIWDKAVAELGKDPREYASLFTGRVRPGIPTTCGLCPAGCGILAYMDRGRLVGLTGNPAHPYNRGTLCALGSAIFNLESGSQRISQPLRRKGERGDENWEVITWAEALGEVTRNLGKLSETGGQAPLVVSVPGRDATPFVQRFVSCFPNCVLDEADAYQGAVDKRIRRDFWGNGEGVPDLAHARLVLNFGGDPLGNIRSLVGTAQQWSRGLEHGARWITMDPRLSETANASNEWVPLRPGTYRAFAAAVTRHLFEKEVEDRPFLKQKTDLDPVDLRRAFQPWTTERAARLCQVPEARVRRIAEAFAETERAVAVFGSGATAHRGGFDTACSVLLLNLLKGNLGRKGGCRIRQPVSWQQPDAVPNSRDVRTIEGTLFHALKSGDLDPGSLITCHTNPAATDPACGATEDILKDRERIPFHVAMTSTWNETVRLADVVLPVSTYLAAWGVTQGFSASDGSCWVGLRQPVLGWEAKRRSSEEVLLAIAKEVGGDLRRAFPYADTEAYYTSLVEATFPGKDRLKRFSELREKGFFFEGDAETSGLQRIFLAHRVERMTSSLPEPTIWARPRDDERILVLSSAPTAGDESSNCPWIGEIDHATPVWMHPTAAAEMGFREGDRVVLEGPAGEIRTRVRMTEGIRPDVVAVQVRVGDALRAPDKGMRPGRVEDPMLSNIWWIEESYGENPRRIIPWPEDPSREAPGWVGTKVKLRRA